MQVSGNRVTRGRTLSCEAMAPSSSFTTIPQMPDSRGRVLIADDDPQMLSALERLLQRAGFEVVAASDGGSTAALLKESDFDVLISDINMPGNAGLELIAGLPKIVAGLPVILLTGSPSIETAARSVSLSVRAYLTKPADTAELCRLLDEAVEDRRAFRAMGLERDRLAAWQKELESIETLLKTRGPNAGSPMAGYLKVSLRNVILILSDMERTASSLEQRGGSASQTDHMSALRRTVDVLQRTKQSFKSRELADLRRQLEDLLSRE